VVRCELSFAGGQYFEEPRATKAGLRVKPTKTERLREISIPQSAVEIPKIIQVTQERNRAMFDADYRATSISFSVAPIAAT
jgi:hypothetical protein